MAKRFCFLHLGGNLQKQNQTSLHHMGPKPGQALLALDRVMKIFDELGIIVPPKNEYMKQKRITIGQRTSLVFHVNEQATILHLHFSIPIKQIVKVASLTYSLQRRWRLGTSSINTRFIDTYPISSSEWPWLTDLCTRYGDADPLIDKHTVTILGPNVNAVITEFGSHFNKVYNSPRITARP